MSGMADSLIIMAAVAQLGAVGVTVARFFRERPVCTGSHRKALQCARNASVRTPPQRALHEATSIGRVVGTIHAGDWVGVLLGVRVLSHSGYELGLLVVGDFVDVRASTFSARSSRDASSAPARSCLTCECLCDLGA